MLFRSYTEGDSSNPDDRLHYAITDLGRKWCADKIPNTFNAVAEGKFVEKDVRESQVKENSADKFILEPVGEDKDSNLLKQIDMLKAEIAFLKELNKAPSNNLGNDIGYAVLPLTSINRLTNDFEQAKKDAAGCVDKDDCSCLIVRCFKVATVKSEIVVSMEE